VPAKRQSIMLCLIQCGETAWSEAGRIQGAMDLPLSDAGRMQISAQLHRLSAAKAAMIHHPADEAAADTAHLCAGRINARTKATLELADPHLGLLEGLTEQEFATRFPKRYKQWEDDLLSLAPPEGEPMMNAADRLLKAVAKILKRSRSQEVAIVLHPLGLGLLRCWLADRPMNDVRTMLANRPRIERYALPVKMISALETANATAPSG
jgi:broad specificity phosphatase PhoE